MMMRNGILLERQGNPHGGRVLVAESAIPLRLGHWRNGL